MWEREHPLLFYQAPFPLKSENCPTLPPPTAHFYFVYPLSPLKNQIFQWIPILKLKVTKFLVKLSQFKFLLNTDKNIFVYKLFLFLNISDVSFFFMQKLDPQQKEGGRYNILGALELPAR